MFRFFIATCGLIFTALTIIACNHSEPTPIPTISATPTPVAQETQEPEVVATPTPSVDMVEPNEDYLFTPPTDTALMDADICNNVSPMPIRPTGKADFSEHDYFAIFETDKGTIKARLFDDKASLYVENFINLACIGFYDGTVFHRVIEGFVSQGGDPQGNGTGGPGYQFADIFPRALSHSQAGILSMANSGIHTNGSQFFITHSATPHLDSHDATGTLKLCEHPDVSCHGVFGIVYEGLDIATSLQQGDTLVSVKIYTHEPIDEFTPDDNPFDVPFPNDQDLADASICDDLPEPISTAVGYADFSELDYAAIIQTHNEGTIKALLFDDLAPEVTEHFITRACKGFYDGTNFSDVSNSFYAIGGVGGTGIENYPLPNKFSVDLSHSRAGVMSMENIPDPNVAENGEFFIFSTPVPYVDSTYINGLEKPCDTQRIPCYPVFGYVYEGNDVIEALKVGDTITVITIKSYKPVDGN